MRTAGLLLTDRNSICPKLVSLVKDFVGTDCQRNDHLMVQNGSTSVLGTISYYVRFTFPKWLEHLYLAENVYLFV